MRSPKAKSATFAPLSPLTPEEVQALRQDAKQAGKRLREIAAMTPAQQAELRKRIQMHPPTTFLPFLPEGLIDPHQPNQPGVMTDDPPPYAATRSKSSS